MSEVVIDGLKIQYVDVGEGSPVLLLHGWLANKESMAPKEMFSERMVSL